MFYFFGFLRFRVDFPSQKLHNFLVFHFSKNAFSVFTPLAIPRERVLTRFRKCFIFGDFASPNCSESLVINGDFVSIVLCSQLFWTRSLSFLQGKMDTESSFFHGDVQHFRFPHAEASRNCSILVFLKTTVKAILLWKICSNVEHFQPFTFDKCSSKTGSRQLESDTSRENISVWFCEGRANSLWIFFALPCLLDFLKNYVYEA